jgi:eukaryotic-like serine/threonine-protein kinase
MDTSRLQLLITIVEKALSIEPDRREAYLHEACGSDPAMIEEVREILLSVGDSDTFWGGWREWSERQIGDLLRDTGHTGRVSDGDRIGSWRLLRLIGRGGMGDVYLAERADGSFRKKAALKVIRPLYRHGELDESAVYRFRQERQILAQLNHPNIARLYDGGHTRDGLPWLAMEYVDGLPITVWSGEQNRSLKERLELLKKVCEAIQHAHKHLIVHRDLKPENILVTGDGEVKILDFGIAKLLGDDITDVHKLDTRPDQRAMSLAYAAPEQITGEPVTTATDVYALGLLLYELIAGVYPFTLEGLNIVQIEQVIRTREPVKPSVVRKSQSARSSGSRDLDAITMKALRKEPDQRYESAGHLLDDIIRYQNNKPVTAQRETLRYRAGKFVRRHRRSLVTMILVVLGFIGFSVYHARQLAYERDLAWREAARAEQVSQFLADMFSSSDPSEARGRDITARDILDRGAERIHGLIDQPDLQAAMMQVIGRVYWSIGSYDEAIPILEQAIALRDSLSDEPGADLALSHFTLGSVYHDLGQYRQALPHFERAVHIFRSDPDHVSAEYATSLESLGYVEDARRNYSKAESLHREALDIRLHVYGTDHPDVARSHYSVAISRSHQGDLDNAIAGHREALRIFRLHKQIDTRFGARVLLSLGNALVETGSYEEAEDVLSESLRINRKIHGNTHLDTGLVVRALATLHRNRGDFEAAEELFGESISILREAIGERHVMIGQVLQEVGDMYIRSSTPDYEKAERAFRESLSVFGAADHVHPVRIITSHRKLGTTLVQLERFEEAEQFLSASLAAASEINSEDAGNEQLVTRSLEELVRLYNAWGKDDQARVYSHLLSLQ